MSSHSWPARTGAANRITDTTIRLFIGPPKREAHTRAALSRVVPMRNVRRIRKSEQGTVGGVPSQEPGNEGYARLEAAGPGPRFCEENAGARGDEQCKIAADVPVKIFPR